MSDSEALGLDFLRSKVPLAAKSVISRIKRKNRQQKSLEEWRVIQISSFTGILIETAIDIVTAYRKKRLATVAWLARNLLELSVWIAYCTSSEDMARSFWNDTLKDVYGLAREWEKFDYVKVGYRREVLSQHIYQLFGATEAQEKIDETNERIASQCTGEQTLLSDDELSKMAAFLGEESIRDNYLRVKDAAAATGRADMFTMQNKYLSKFAHPTALLIHMPSTNDDNQPMDFFLDDAVYLAAECLALISAFEAAVFPKKIIH